MSDELNPLNPYEAAPPLVTTFPEGEVKKPASVVVFGILNLVYGLLGTLGLIFVIASMFLDLPKDANNPFEQALEDPTYKVLNIVSQAVMGAMSIVLLLSGIGLLTGKHYGRRCALIYAVTTIFIVLATSVINIIYISFPAFARAEELPGGPEKFVSIVVGAAMFFQPICGNIFPVLLLIFMMRAPVKRYFKVS